MYKNLSFEEELISINHLQLPYLGHLLLLFRRVRIITLQIIRFDQVRNVSLQLFTHSFRNRLLKNKLANLKYSKNAYRGVFQCRIFVDLNEPRIKIGVDHIIYTEDLVGIWPVLDI